MSDSTKSESNNNISNSQFRNRMEQFYEDAVELKEDKKPCSGVRKDLKECIISSECVQKHNKSPRECLMLKPSDPICPSECLIFKQTFFDCKRSLLDARQRFRGRKGY